MPANASAGPRLNSSPQFSLDHPRGVGLPVVAASVSLAERGAVRVVPQAGRLWLHRARIVASYLALLARVLTWFLAASAVAAEPAAGPPQAAYEAAEAFLKAHPDNVDGALTRFRKVAILHPGTPWAKRAAERMRETDRADAQAGAPELVKALESHADYLVRREAAQALGDGDESGAHGRAEGARGG